MTPEIEVKFANVDHESVRKKLIAAGARLVQPMRLMRRVVFHNQTLKEKNAFIRVRDEGNRVTVTYKQFDAISVDGAKEIETVIDDFDIAVALLEQTGLSNDAYQETRRETWLLGGVEVVLDEWLWVPTYIEIEAKTEDEVRSVAELLGFDWSRALFGGVASIYMLEYPTVGDEMPEIINHKVGRIRFQDPVPTLFLR